MEQQLKIACGFLLFTSFNNTDDPIQVAIDKAYTDMSRRVLSIDDGQKADLKKKAGKKIHTEIEKLNKTDDYNKWHSELCGELINIYSGKHKNEKRSFMFGHAQKWVNMTMKYLYIFYCCEKEKILSDILKCDCKNEQWFTAVEKHCNNFHVPIDGYILEKACNVEALKNKIKKVDKTTYKLKINGLDYAWSRIPEKNNDVYINLQKDIRAAAEKEGINPLDWEGKAWLEIAKDRKTMN